MSYDIPPQLEHKEKIMFGLTFSQLAYALPSFLLIAGLIFKSGLRLEISITLSSLVLCLAVFFMFFDGKSRILNFLRFVRTKEVQVNETVLKDIVNIKEIKNDIIVTEDSRLAILEVIPMNFMIKQDDEQEAILIGFQKMLNSLDFPIQIHISSSPIALNKHFENLEKKMTGFESLFQSYSAFLQCSTKDTMNRKFHVIIREKYDLNIQTTICEEKLRSLGMKVRRLDNDNIVNFFFNYISCGKTKEAKEEVKEFMHFLLAPEKITFYHDFFTIGDMFYKVLTVTGYPHSVEKGFLDKMISATEDYDISISIEPFPIEHTMIQLNRELQKQQSDLYSDSKKGILNPSLDIKFKSTKQVLEDLQKGRQKLFNVSLYVICKAKTKEEVNHLITKVKADFDGLMMQSKEPKFQMIDAYESMLPLAKDRLKVNRNVHTIGLSAFFPFSSPFFDMDEQGILMGLNRNKIPYIKDIFALTNANGLVLATSGAGKSYFTKLFLARQFMNGCSVLIIDPQGEYGAITRHYGGEVITISKNSDTIINPLDLMGHDYLEKRLSLIDLFQIMFGELSEVQKAILDRAVDETYARKNINRDTWTDAPPKIEDLYAVLSSMEKKCASQEKVTYRALLNRLGMYTDRGVFSFLNRSTNLQFDKDFVCFNIGDMPKQVKPVIMYLVLDYIYMRMRESKKKKLLVIDEAWAMLQGVSDAGYIFEIVKTCRKFNLGLLMITQDVADLVGSKAGHAVLANTSYTFLLRQKASVVNNVVATFNLSRTEKDFLLTAERGNGIILLENDHQEIEVIASEAEHEKITTNPNEPKVEKKAAVAAGRDVNITLDIERDVYPKEGLKPEEQNFLNNNGYKFGMFHNLEKSNQKGYFVKVRPPESILHTYYVDLIYQEIRKKTDKVTKYWTERPDIVFTDARGQEIAVEVETGIDMKKHKKKLEDKFAAVLQKYGSNSWIFLTNAKLENSYKRYGLAIFYRLDIPAFVRSKFPSK